MPDMAQDMLVLVQTEESAIEEWLKTTRGLEVKLDELRYDWFLIDKDKHYGIWAIEKGTLPHRWAESIVRSSMEDR